MIIAAGSSPAFVTIMVALIGAGGAVAAAYLTVTARRTHVLVNSRLQRSLEVIEVLSLQLAALGVEPNARDEG